METKQNKTEVAILTSGKTDFKTMAITREKKDPAIPLLSICLKKPKTLN